ncbi:GntR family transcriptional regulator YhfZ [Paenibacillus sp. FSL E2-8871]|uniref:GntR family transcriptional regulator YhfZ n=1 Tax=Paenibacillus sp. FSL E2-8871 TaxID=2975326 RepID=UPI0030F8340F
MMKDKLYQKSGVVIMHLARVFMTKKKGDRIETVSEYEKELGYARGTIQNALSVLKTEGAVTLESRGHVGTFVKEIDYKLVWMFTGIDFVMGAMPLPYSKLYEGFATGLYKSAEKHSGDLNMAYVRGASVRIQMLLKGAYDFVVVSRLAANQAIAEGLELEIGLYFGPKTYLSEHVILFADSTKQIIEDGMTIGLDPKSIDQSYITKALCEGKHVKLLEMPYNQIVQSIQSNKIDAGVWNLDEIKEKELQISYQSISNNAAFIETSEAVILTAKNNKGINNILKELIQSDIVLDYQRKVVNIEIDPSY